MTGALRRKTQADLSLMVCFHFQRGDHEPLKRSGHPPPHPLLVQALNPSVACSPICCLPPSLSQKRLLAKRIAKCWKSQIGLPVRLEGWRKVGSQLLLAFLGGVRAPGGEAA